MGDLRGDNYLSFLRSDEVMLDQLYTDRRSLSSRLKLFLMNEVMQVCPRTLNVVSYWQFYLRDLIGSIYYCRLSVRSFIHAQARC